MKKADVLKNVAPKYIAAGGQTEEKTEDGKMKNLTGKLAFLLVLAITITIAQAGVYAQSSEEVILQWNRVLMTTINTPGQQPATVLAGRSTAMVHLAMYDAVNSIEGSHTPYLTDVPGSPNASVEAAAAQAAHDVLVNLFPTRQSIFDAELAATLSGIEKNRARQGIAVGRIAAENIIAKRANDGWFVTPPAYVLPTTPGNWQPTPPANAAAALTHFSGVQPFATSGSGQFSPNPPPSLTSAEYTADFNEAKTLGAVNSTTRTAEQTLIAQVWANTPNTLVVWNNAARDASVSRGLPTAARARLFALFHMVFHDTLQQTFSSKYVYGLWRPVTAIRRADEDGNPNTESDLAWTPLLVTPPYPTYAGNAAGQGISFATILGLVFGRDDIPVTATFAGPPAAMRSYASYTAMANEQARSRIYGGIHYNFDTVAGQAIGKNVANYTFLNFLRPRCSGN
ncbi:MAG: phosphatase PAP2 family protein [Acidobacteria bacterium]|nr:phosphatase PAP2 family protein [Acidobacteriota bacterium]